MWQTIATALGIYALKDTWDRWRQPPTSEAGHDDDLAALNRALAEGDHETVTRLFELSRKAAIKRGIEWGRRGLGAGDGADRGAGAADGLRVEAGDAGAHGRSDGAEG